MLSFNRALNCSKEALLTISLLRLFNSGIVLWKNESYKQFIVVPSGGAWPIKVLFSVDCYFSIQICVK